MAVARGGKTRGVRHLPSGNGGRFGQLTEDRGGKRGW